ncbi:hypothetical protein [Photobacterium sanguinicancri]|uniref:hypothetical protein n=1 Tax=Photobacterium sanguinicancri TaxID=875932 RepID=UPI003D1321FE
MSSIIPIKKQQFDLQTVHSMVTTHGKKIHSVMTLCGVDYAPLLCNGGLLHTLLTDAEKKSQIKPINNPNSHSFRHCLNSLIRHQQGKTGQQGLFSKVRKLLRTNPVSMSSADFFDLFGHIEKILLEDCTLSNRQRYLSSEQFRIWIRRYVPTYGKGYHTKSIRYKSLIERPVAPARSLIEPKNARHLPPLEALPHGNIAELEAKALERVKAAIDEIRTACVTVFDQYDQIQAEVEALKEANLPVGIAEFDSLPPSASKTRAAIKAHKKKQLSNFKAEEVLAYRSQQLHTLFDVPQTVIVLPEHSWMFMTNVLPKSRNNVGNDASSDYLLSPWLLPKEVRIACVFVLMMKTYWNKKPIREINLLSLVAEKAEANQCSPEAALASGLVLKGFKSKTDDDTPEVIIEPSDKLEMRVLHYLYHHANNLLRLQAVNSIFDGYGQGCTSVFNDSGLTAWQKAHNIPEFTLEQLRNQSAADFILTKADIDALCERLGHGKLKTTQGYVDELLAPLDRAISLEFQRRFEASVIFQQEGKQGVLARSFDPHHIDPNLFIPLGDGTACSDPTQIEDGLPGETICAGRTCHKGEGCPRNNIIINIEQTELLLRTHSYYISHFVQLRADPEYFHEYSLPAMRFNYALVAYVRRERPDIIIAAEAQIKHSKKEV